MMHILCLKVWHGKWGKILAIICSHYLYYYSSYYSYSYFYYHFIITEHLAEAICLQEWAISLPKATIDLADDKLSLATKGVMVVVNEKTATHYTSMVMYQTQLFIG